MNHCLPLIHTDDTRIVDFKRKPWTKWMKVCSCVFDQKNCIKISMCYQYLYNSEGSMVRVGDRWLPVVWTLWFYSGESSTVLLSTGSFQAHAWVRLKSVRGLFRSLSYIFMSVGFSEPKFITLFYIILTKDLIFFRFNNMIW